MNDQEPTIFVVDDDSSLLRALSRLLRAANYNVVAFDSPASFLEYHDRSVHGCIVLDVQMPGLNGLQLQEVLAAEGALLPIIFLTARGDIPMTVRAMKGGAIDFLTKPVDDTDLLKAIEAAVSRDTVKRLGHAEVTEIRRRLARLTPREHEVMGYVISGWLNKQTAAELGTVEKTIKVHRSRILEKMEVRSVAELVHLAERVGVAGSAPAL